MKESVKQGAALLEDVVEKAPEAESLSSQPSLESTVPGKQVTVELVEKLLNLRPPYMPEHILKIEQIKKPVDSSPSKSSKCSYCKRPERFNQNGKSTDKFLTCADCGSSFHAHGCLKYSARLVDNILDQRVKWQCLECKRCNVCLDTCESLLLCDKCDRGYHKECCSPPLSKRPKSEFKCMLCRHLDQNNKTESNNTSISSVGSKKTRQPRIEKQGSYQK